MYLIWGLALLLWCHTNSYGETSTVEDTTGFTANLPTDVTSLPTTTRRRITTDNQTENEDHKFNDSKITITEYPPTNATDVDSGTEKLPFFWEYKMSLDVQAYAGLIVVLLGMIGNTLCIAVLSRKATSSSTSIYLTCLACADLTVTVIGQLTRVFPRAMTGIDTGTLNPWWCSTWFFINHSASTISGWTLVAVTIERTLVVYLPLRAREICTTKKARMAIILIIVLCSAVYLHYFWTYGALYETHGDRTVVVAGCTILKDKPEIMPYMMLVRPWQDFVIRSAAPFACLLICNCLIIGKLIYEHQKRKGMTEGGQHQNDNQMTSITAMLLTVSFAYLICISPLQIMYLVDKSDPFGWKMDERWKAQVALRWGFAIAAYYANHAINFILYFVSGSEFRRDLRLLLSRIPGCSRCAPPQKQNRPMTDYHSSSQNTLGNSNKASSTTSLNSKIAVIDVSENGTSNPGNNKSLNQV